MAQYTINHTCGHTETARLFGKTTEREKRISWLESRKCTKCFAQEQQERFQKENQESAQKSQEMDLPQLVGSEKQIAWAESIRVKAINSKENILLPLESVPKDKLDIYVSLKESLEELKSETSAKWWIENRDMVNYYLQVKAREMFSKGEKK